MEGTQPQTGDINAATPNHQTPTPHSLLDLKNELANSSSPYLRSHKDNLVAWQEWSPQSIGLAKTYEKPIFLSIGYSACHWCHVMSHESFESPDIASLLNTYFIPVKVDRESRPDLDDIYMNYVTATTGSGGWPLNVFLTPDLQPLFGGTYWPSPTSGTAVPEAGNASEDRPLNFLDIVQKIEEIWRNERQKCLAGAADITRQLQAFAAEGIHAQSSVPARGVEEENDPPEPLDLDLIDDALDHFIRGYDSKYGGFVSRAGFEGPKFPTPVNLTFLLRIGASIARPSTHTRFGFPNPVPGILGGSSCTQAAGMALHTLQSMSRSALHDHLGNGFHRYSVTADWNLPHFEKMLYDNAQLLSVYCDAWALARDPEVLGTIYDLVEYLANPESPIVRKDGGWYASEDADSRTVLTVGSEDHREEKKEGAFYVWTTKELDSILGDQDSNILARHFGISEHGNIPREQDVHDEFINQNVLHIDATPSVLAKEFGLKEEEIVRIIKNGKKKLLDFRNSKRAAPDVDDKVILSWNALAISALARAANTLSSIDVTRARQSREAAIKSASFIKNNMFNSQTGRLTRIFSDLPSASTVEETRDLAFVDDYAYLIQSLRTLFDLTYDRQYLDWALQLQATLDRDFSASHGGGYYQSTTTSLTERTGAVSSPTNSGAHATVVENQDIATPYSSSIDTQQQPQAKIPDQILNLKPGTDNSLPSPNGVIAGNLLYLASYVSTLSISESSLDPAVSASTSSPPDNSESLISQARATINAFSPEIIQHPFLYVSLLSAVVIDTVEVKSLIIPGADGMTDADVEATGLRGFGRTVVRASGVKTGEVLICERTSTGGVCRVLREGELDDFDVVDEGDGAQDKVVGAGNRTEEGISEPVARYEPVVLS